jgi:hypothetical protein
MDKRERQVDKQRVSNRYVIVVDTSVEGHRLGRSDEIADVRHIVPAMPAKPP